MNIEYVIIFANLFIFLIAPFLPSVVYDYFVETYYGATILLLLSLYSITYGYLAAVSSFTGIASLYAESHARKSRKVNTKLAEAEVSYEKQLEAAEKIVPNEVHPEVHTPDEDEAKEVLSYKPEESDNNEFKPVDSSIDHKDVLPTLSLSKDALNVFEK